MIRAVGRVIATLVASILVVGCDSSGDHVERFNLLVEVSGTGDATATSIQITGGSSGDPLVVNPTLPWQLFMFAREADTVRIIVDGTAQNGVLSVVLQDNPNVDPSPSTYASEDCGDGIPVCMIDLEHDF